MPKLMYFFREFITGFYWVLWIAIDVFVLFQIYYYYPTLTVGLSMLIIGFVSLYYEVKLYHKLVDRLFKE